MSSYVMTSELFFGKKFGESSINSGNSSVKKSMNVFKFRSKSHEEWNWLCLLWIGVKSGSVLKVAESGAQKFDASIIASLSHESSKHRKSWLL